MEPGSGQKSQSGSGSPLKPDLGCFLPIQYLDFPIKRNQLKLERYNVSQSKIVVWWFNILSLFLIPGSKFRIRNDPWNRIRNTAWWSWWEIGKLIKKKGFYDLNIIKRELTTMFNPGTSINSRVKKNYSTLCNLCNSAIFRSISRLSADPDWRVIKIRQTLSTRLFYFPINRVHISYPLSGYPAIDKVSNMFN